MMSPSRIRACGISIRRTRTGCWLASRRLAWHLLVRLHVAVGLQLVLPVSDDHFVWRHAAGNFGQVPFSRRNRNRPYLHGLVLFHDIDETTLRAALQSRGGNDRCVLFRFQQQMYIYKLIRPELVITVIENSLQLSRSSGLINLIVNGE